MTQGELFDSTIDGRFLRFHAENPHILDLFIAKAEEVKRSGDDAFGAKAIAEQVRWDRRIRTNDKNFKLNNNYVSRYARLVAKTRPDLAHLFEVRSLKTQRRSS